MYYCKYTIIILLSYAIICYSTIICYFSLLPSVISYQQFLRKSMTNFIAVFPCFANRQQLTRVYKFSPSWTPGGNNDRGSFVEKKGG